MREQLERNINFTFADTQFHPQETLGAHRKLNPAMLDYACRDTQTPTSDLSFQSVLGSPPSTSGGTTFHQFLPTPLPPFPNNAGVQLFQHPLPRARSKGFF